MYRFGTVLLWCLFAYPWPLLAQVNINTASLEELDSLPYVGASTAQLIISGRPYSSVSDIQRVSGFGSGPGSRNYDAIIPLITISGPTSVAVPEASTDSDAASANSSVPPQVSSTEVGLRGLRVNAPSYAYVNQPVEFAVEPIDGQRGRLIRYTWNFGDGIAERLGSPLHSYRYPGRYVVVVEGEFRQELVVARHEIEIVPIQLKLEDLGNGDVRITNHGEREIDLYRMTIAGRGGFTFPKHSVLLPGAAMVVSVPGLGTVALFDVAGKSVVQSQNGVAAEPASTGSVTMSRVSLATAPAAVESDPLKTETMIPTSSMPTAAIAADQTGSAPWPYVGLVGLILLGLYVVFTDSRQGS